MIEKEHGTESEDNILIAIINEKNNAYVDYIISVL